MELRHWVIRLLHCKTLEDFRAVLSEFTGAPGLTLADRRIISGVYTPRVMKLLAGSEESRFVLEDLAALCWGYAK